MNVLFLYFVLNLFICLTNKVSLHSEELINQMKAKRTFLGQTPSKYVGRPVKQEPETQEVHVGEFKLKQVPMLDVVKLPLKQRTQRKTKYAKESVRTCIPHSVLEENSSDQVHNVKLDGLSVA